jgi:hypothetical protein
VDVNSFTAVIKSSKRFFMYLNRQSFRGMPKNSFDNLVFGK